MTITELTNHEIIKIVAETITESGKDCLHLDDRRPLIHQVLSLAFDVFQIVSESESINVTEMKTRDMDRALLVGRCMHKINLRLPAIKTTGAEA